MKKNIAPALTLLMAFCYIFSMAGEKSIPQRKLVLKKHMAAIGLEGPQKKYYEIGQESRTSFAKEVVLPESEKILMRLQENDNEIYSYKFNPEDVHELCGQTEYLAQSLVVAKCWDAARIKNCLMPFGNQKSLEEIVFYRGNVSANALEPLTRIAPLRIVSFNRCDVLPEGSLGKTLSNTQITDIYIDRTNIKPLIKTLSVIRTLRHICIEGNDINDEMSSISILNKLKSLEKISFVNTGMTDQGVVCLSRLTNLQEIELIGQKGIEDFSALGGMENLRVLNIDETMITSASLNKLRSLKRLKIMGNPDIIGS